jgi:hypothetical protein
MRTDRLATMTEALAGAIETMDMAPHLDPKVTTALDLVRRIARIDLPGLVRSTAATWLRSLPSSAEADPERAEAALLWATHTLAWLRGETDTPPGDIVL